MHVNAPCVVSLTWRLFDGQHQLLGELTEPTEFLCGGDDLMPGIEIALEGQAAGWQAQLVLEPSQAFGDYDPGLVCFEDRSLLPAGVEEGMAFEGLPAGARTPGMPADVLYRVTELYPSHAVLDGNHPLAGMQMKIELSLHAVRAADDDERASRTVGDTPVQVVPILR
ncbi:MAG: peptidylprolyl isomerase [Aquabacterium sp.]